MNAFFHGIRRDLEITDDRRQKYILVKVVIKRYMVRLNP